MQALSLKKQDNYNAFKEEIDSWNSNPKEYNFIQGSFRLLEIPEIRGSGLAIGSISSSKLLNRIEWIDNRILYKSNPVFAIGNLPTAILDKIEWINNSIMHLPEPMALEEIWTSGLNNRSQKELQESEPKFPKELIHIKTAINKSKYILELEDDFDDEGSPKYDIETWERAVSFIANFANWIFDNTGVVIDEPLITHGPEESIDILWKNKKYRLLINIPADKDKPANFYGDDYKLEVIRVTFDPSKYKNGLILCLLETK